MLFLIRFANIPTSTIKYYATLNLFSLAKFYFFYLVLATGFVWACHSNSQELSTIANSRTETSVIYTKLTPSDFARQLDRLNNELLLDVRTPTEYHSGHLPEAQLIDFRAADFRQRVKGLNHDQPVMIYCAAGGRSSAAVDILRELGFTEIYELQGGLTSWVGEGRSTAK